MVGLSNHVYGLLLISEEVELKKGQYNACCNARSFKGVVLCKLNLRLVVVPYDGLMFSAKKKHSG